MAKEKVLVAGKRTGTGFVTGRLALAEALAQSTALAVRIGDVYVGRAGLVNYLRYFRGHTSTVKVVPTGRSLRIEHGSAGMVEIPANKWLKPDQAVVAQFDAVWVEVGDRDGYLPNVGARDLAAALERVLAVARKGRANEADPLSDLVLRGNGSSLSVLGSDNYRVAEVTVPCFGVEGSLVVAQEDARTMVRLLKRASRARLEFREETRTVWTAGENREVTVPFAVLYADRVKLETTVRQVRHPLLEGVPETVKPGPASARAYLGAKELAEVLRAAGLVAAMPDGTKKQPLFIAVREGQVEFTAYDAVKKDLVMAISVEAEASGEGEIALDALMVLPILKGFGSGSVEITLPADVTHPVTFQEDGAWFICMPLASEKKPEAKPATGAEELPEEEAGEVYLEEAETKGETEAA